MCHLDIRFHRVHGLLDTELEPLLVAVEKRVKRYGAIAPEVIVRRVSLVKEIGISTKETPPKYIYPFRKIHSLPHSDK